MPVMDTAMVLAAGLGERMRPLTDGRPKPLVELAGKPLIDHVLDRLGNAGVERAVVNVHYRAGMLEAHLAGRVSPKIAISCERDGILDTGGGVVHALGLIGADAFFIHNSDSVWLDGTGSPLARMIAQWDPARMDSLLLLAATRDSVGYEGPGDFTMDENGLVARRAEGETAPFVFAGVSIAAKAMFADAPKGAFSLNRLWDRSIERGRLYGNRLDGTWMHVGTPQALGEAEAAIGAGGP